MEHSDELYHYGVLGMHWGVRRYQNKDGSLTDDGRKRFYKVRTNESLKNRDTLAARNLFKKDKKYYESFGESWRYGNALNYFVISELERKISEIDSGKIKAGTDFVVSREGVALTKLLGKYANGNFARNVVDISPTPIYKDALARSRTTVYYEK